MPRPQPQKILRGRIKGTLRRKYVLQAVAEQRQYLIGRVVANGPGAVHHQPRLGKHFAPRIRLENAPPGESRDEHGEDEHRTKRQVDSKQQAHGAIAVRVLIFVVSQDGTIADILNHSVL